MAGPPILLFGVASDSEDLYLTKILVMELNLSILTSDK